MKFPRHIRRAVDALVDAMGYTLIANRFTYWGRLDRILASANVDLVIDVGANIGQFSSTLIKRTQYLGRIISFEPLGREFSQLSKVCRRHSQWHAEQYALAAHSGTALINVTENSVSSSFLVPTNELCAAEPQAGKIIRQEQVHLITLDEAISRFGENAERLFVKIDAQGYESQILNGATHAIDHIQFVQLELPLSQMYEGAATFAQMQSRMSDAGYQLVSADPGFSHPNTGEVLEVDCIFRRAN